MIFRKLIYLTLTCFISSQALATAIVNGDFSSCDYTGWEKDTDGSGDIPTSNNFTIVGSSPTCAASINVDYQDINVDDQDNEAFFANTLYQVLDFSAASDSTFLLTMDFSVDSAFTNLDPDFIADYFAVGLFDGVGKYFDETGHDGLLVDNAINGAKSFNLSFTLDNFYANKTGWSLYFQVDLGADDGGFTDLGGSSLILNNVSLSEIPNRAVPAPGTITVFALGLFGLMLRRKNSSYAGQKL